ncbi:hypothetical protein ACIPLC_33400 [Kitasatospora sp. NPDC086801]|uniref:hypothetical protein n=1 Tax=Kitasatospora sp. NPDC086801 TaxID=3364066 RepID=UPI0037F4D144
MTTRILYWNIDKFGELVDKRGRPNPVKDADYIEKVMTAAGPQFVVIVEVLSDDPTGQNSESFRGSLRDSNTGPQECLKLLSEIAKYLGADWKLVPPLHTGPSEAVAIFYDSRNWYFTGPNIWAGSLSDAPAQGRGAGSYPDQFSKAMSNRKIPGSSHNNPNLEENKCAARVILRDSAGALISEIGGPKLHAPYMATFMAENPKGGDCKAVSIIAIHGPASNQPATGYLTALARAKEVSEDLQGGEVRVVLGDFNLNSVANDGVNFKLNSTYHALTGAGSGYSLLLEAKGGKVVANESGGYPSFFGTYLEKTGAASYWPLGVNTSKYPGYRYTASSGKNFSLDNAYLKAKGFDLSKADLTVFNPIVGSPYTAYPSSENPHTGSRPLTNLLAANFTPRAAVQETCTSQAPKGEQPRFDNAYKRFYETSDHLPLVIEF